MDKMAFLTFNIYRFSYCPNSWDYVCHFSSRRAKSLGFTIIELMVTLLVVAIMLTIAIPAFRSLILNNRLTTSADSLVNALNYTRSLALTNNSSVKICPFNSANSIVCGNNWSSGWIVVTQPASGTAVLLRSQQNSTVSTTVSANNTSVTFDFIGLASGATNFSFCDARGGTFARSIQVMATGYVQSGDTPGQAVWNNNPMTCP